jgi:hypothetical protein
MRTQPLCDPLPIQTVLKYRTRKDLALIRFWFLLQNAMQVSGIAPSVSEAGCFGRRCVPEWMRNNGLADRHHMLLSL